PPEPPPVSSAERQQVLGALERLQAKLVQREEWTHSDTLGNLRETLQSPLFSHILTLQHSIKQLRSQLAAMPPDACSDFSFSKKGQLIMSAVDPAASSLIAVPTCQLTVFCVQGRQTEQVSLTRPLTGGLGFSVVGLNPAGTSSHGVFVKHIQPGGIAHRDGRLRERDQILVINGSPLESGISQQQALSLLQQPGETVELVVARDGQLDPPPISTDPWGHVEEIELVNDGSGLGFGIVGGKSTGVVVRTLVPNSVADKDGRLRTGDHILRIGATPTSGLTSDQVVKVLQGCGSHVTMLIARDPRGQRSTAPAPPPPPDSAPVSSLPPPLPQRRANAVGVFVKHVVPGSAADQSGNIRIHDRLIALDGVSLHGLTNQEVLEVMKQTGQTVVLTLVRKKPRTLERSLDKGTHCILILTPFTSTDTVFVFAASEAELRAKWQQALGPQYQVLVRPNTHLNVFTANSEPDLLPIHTVRLGVELDSFDGHHYISSVAPGGPVDRHGVLRPEDELLEVNDVQLYGKSRREAVSFLKEVPPPFTLVCCRHPASELEPEPEPALQSEPEPARQSQPSVEEVRQKIT
uniref:PATJ crumbs cell polarity complex component n=1 Tax=Stegastes partitus TaxID=144197 RepID=A0A3B5ALH7_9TELE